MVDEGIVEGVQSLDGAGLVIGCGVIGCWRWGIIAIVEVFLRRFKMGEASVLSVLEGKSPHEILLFEKSRSVLTDNFGQQICELA